MKRAAQRGGGKEGNMIELLLVLDLIVGTMNILLFAGCVWMGYKTGVDRLEGGRKENQ